MSAVDMANTLGTALSSLVLGSILSATIATHPAVTFWTYSVSLIICPVYAGILTKTKFSVLWNPCRLGVGLY